MGMDSSFGLKTRNGARRVLSHQVHVPLPLFILKIAMLIGLIALSTVFIVSSILLTRKLEWQPPPLILVPGLMGSKLYVEASGVDYPKADEKYKHCPGQVPLRKSWLSTYLQNQTDCELYLLSMSSNFEDQPGVSVSAQLRGVPFGSSLWPVQCLYTDEDQHRCDASTYSGNDENYFHRFTTFLMAKLKYQAGRTLFAAPYDWRQHQQSAVMEQFYEDLRVLIERAVQSTGKKAVLLGHSMGNMVIGRFLRSKVDKEWQKINLEATINVAAPYGGSPAIAKAMVSGRSVPLPGNDSIPASEFVAFFRQMGFPANLLPFENAFGQQKVLVKVGDEEFTAARMADFLILVGAPQLVEFYTKNQPEPQQHIPMHCVYSIGKENTVLQVEYASMQDTDEPTKVVMGDGDSRVNAESLRVCEQWKAQGHSVSIKQFDDFLHTHILMKDQFYAHIAELITSF